MNIFRQILVAFLVTAYGIFVWMLVAYFCCWLPVSVLGQVDKYVFKRFPHEKDSSPWWRNAIDQSILVYADLQIANGIAILTAAFATMRTISMYHLQVAIYLAWMSSNTHLTAVSLLQTDFREDRNKLKARRLRIAGMALLALMLMVALVPTTRYNWSAIMTRSVGYNSAYGTPQVTISIAGVPARCFWQSSYSGRVIPDAAWSFLIIVYSYMWKGMLLFRPSQQFLKVTCRRKIQNPLRKRLDRIVASSDQDRQKSHIWLVFQYKLFLGLYIAVWALFNLAESFVSSLWICGAGLVWGSLEILKPRRTISAQTLSAENSWTFGQILPVLLLVVPFLSFFENYTGMSE